MQAREEGGYVTDPTYIGQMSTSAYMSTACKGTHWRSSACVYLLADSVRICQNPPESGRPCPTVLTFTIWRDATSGGRGMCTHRTCTPSASSHWLPSCSYIRRDTLHIQDRPNSREIRLRKHAPNELLAEQVSGAERRPWHSGI